MTPSVAYLNATHSEKLTFSHLQALELGPDWRCFHSLNLSEHEYKRAAELDFVLISATGVLVLEVKGGHVWCDDDGIWTYSSRYGSRRDSEGPFEQASSGMYSLKERLESHLGENFFRGIPFGYGVVFPNCEFRKTSVEWADEMILDQEGIRRPRGMERYIGRLLHYWREKEKRADRLSGEQLQQLVDLLRPSFDRVPSLRSRANQLVYTMEELTSEQYASLDLADEHPRLLYRGGAGTGKTFLAIEMARRHAAVGKEVLLACSSPVLAEYIKSRLATESVRVEAVTADSEISGEFDVLIIDEGQDLLNIAALDQLDRAVRGGLESGTWRIFLDPNRQAGLIGRYEPEALDLLISYGGIQLTLTRNCRNTHDIVLQTRLLTSADLGNPSAGRGPGVVYDYSRTSADTCALVEQRVRDLLDQGVAPGDITILSPFARQDSCLSGVTSIAGTAIIDVTPVISARWPVREVTFASVRDFKGLENKFVILADLNQIDEDQGDINVIYVAMSRAQVALYIIAGESVKRGIAEIQGRNYHLVIRDTTSSVRER